jgi:hypothetical protein
MPVLVISKHSQIEFTLFRFADTDVWSYEYQIFGRVRRGKLPGSLIQADASAQLGVIIDHDMLDQNDNPGRLV